MAARPGHGVEVAAPARQPFTDLRAVVLPRPLRGSWTSNLPAPVLTAAQVRAGCDLTRQRHARLEDALA